MNKRLVQLLESGKVPYERGIFLDCYNQSVSDIAGTITTRIDHSNNYFVTDVKSNSDRKLDKREQLHKPTARQGVLNRGNRTDNNLYGGGNLEPKIMIEAKVQSVGNTNPSGHGINGEVYDTDGIAPTLMKAKGEGVRILEPVIASMRGRNPDNPSERAKSNGRYRQRLEVGGNVSNTITSVQKDNLVIEPQVLTPKRNDYGKKMRKKYESGELDESRHNMTDLVPRNDGIANTLTSVQKDNLLVEPLRIPQATSKGYIEVPEGGLFDGAYPNSQTRRGRVQEGGEICPALTTESANQIFRYESRCRIRKLTERECFRLQDCSEEDIDKIQASGISRTRQYALAGNSITVSVLYYIFRNLFTEQEKTTLF